MAGSLYGAPAEEPETSPMDDMSMGEEPAAAFEPKDDEERAYVEAFPDNAWDENRMAAIKEAVRLCVVRNAGGGYDEPGPKSSPGKGDDLAIAVFGAPKKKK